MHQVWIGILSFLRGNWIEILGFITGAVCVWLLVKENIWTWPTGIANNIFYVFIFLQSGLYADMGLQFVYMAIAIYGWWNWLHGGKGHSALTVNHASFAGIFGYLGLTAGTTAVLYWLLRQFTPSNVPFADGLTTALFLTAQYMMSRKLVQNWWFWITGDVLVIGLYIYKHLYLTSVLYTVFLAMCIAGLFEWQRASRKAELTARRAELLSPGA